MCIPRCEYPRPQLVRANYLCLNGKWQFEIDNAKSGRSRKLYAPEMQLHDEINLPFCPESKLSGIGNTDFMYSVWYKREIELYRKPNRKLIFHIGACDYSCEVWVNGQNVGHHDGGSTPADFDITAAVIDGKNVIAVCADDGNANGCQPTGKQSGRYESYGCCYTRTTGIWQTVWLEEVPETYISFIRLTPDVKACAVHIECTVTGESKDFEVRADAFYLGSAVGTAVGYLSGNTARFTLPLTTKQLWEVGKGRLYDLRITVGEDVVTSYFGLREVHYDGEKMLLNGKPVFQRLVLDQGFYPDGIWTAPTDRALEGDIELSMAVGFNGARLHQKVFEPRFLYHADRHGYLVWGEHGNWGLDLSKPTCYAGFLPEWLEILRRDYNHPSVIGWCPLNETAKNQDSRFVETLYALTKAFDPDRMFIDCSGWTHIKTEVTDTHNYDQNPETFKAQFEPLLEGKPLQHPDHVGITPPSTTTFVSEYGGIGWAVSGGWGYGIPKSEEEFIARYKGLTDVLLDNPKISAFCYTQLTDVEQERNGLYFYDRKPKFDVGIFYAINSRKAAIEK